MLSRGRPGPEITEMAGPSVRVSLLGGDPDPEIVALLGGLHPISAAADLDIVLLVTHLVDHHFLDTETFRPLLQRPSGEPSAAIDSALSATLDGQPVLVAVNRVPAGSPQAFRLSNAARVATPGRTGRLELAAVRDQAILDWARHCGRFSSSEVADLTGLSVVRSGQILTRLEENGDLAAGKAVKKGRGFFYVPA